MQLLPAGMQLFRRASVTLATGGSSKKNGPRYRRLFSNIMRAFSTTGVRVFADAGYEADGA